MKARVRMKTMEECEKKAMQKEVLRELAEYDRKHFTELDAVVLWSLHTSCGFGPKRLKRFYDAFYGEMQALLDRYEMDNSDIFWLCTYKLKEECGVNLDEWRTKHKLRGGGEIND